MSDPLPRGPSRRLSLSLALIVAECLGAYLVKTDLGRVDVSGFTLPTQDGQWVAADLFRLVSASEKNPVPIVVV